MYGKSGELSPNFGRKHSDEVRRKISERTIGDKNPMYKKYGDLNPAFGRKWIHKILNENEFETKYVKPDELNEYISDGWLLGAKPKKQK